MNGNNNASNGSTARNSNNHNNNKSWSTGAGAEWEEWMKGMMFRFATVIVGQENTNRFRQSAESFRFRHFSASNANANVNNNNPTKQMLLQKACSKTIPTFIRLYNPNLLRLNVKNFFSRGCIRPYTIKRTCNDTLGSSTDFSLSTTCIYGASHNRKFMLPHSSSVVLASQISIVRNYSEFRSLRQQFKNHWGRSLNGEDWKSTALAIGGATLTFFLLPHLLTFVLNGALAYGVYRLIKSGLHHYYQLKRIQDVASGDRRLKSFSDLFSIRPATRRDGDFIDGGRAGLGGGLTNLFESLFIPFSSSVHVDRLYELAITELLRNKQYRDILERDLGSLSPENVQFSKPYSISMAGVSAFDSLQGGYQENKVEIEFSGMTPIDEEVIVRATGFLTAGNVSLGELIVYLPTIGRQSSISMSDASSPNSSIPEAEFRDIK
ncbi:13897_t:CDS:2 [Ambispora leptoticha]|uniref:13897_t:CDS:1 n=1 Tax=Ambispora leptoticha TaxID=144679 RepID=A0A9N8VMR8_9GLOM|nr:13897_t:CDS:2 [Ambispora leptoticha]